MSALKVIGNTSVRSLLKNTVEQGRISHAQMFVAPEGAGGLAVAIEYACMVLGINTGQIFSTPDLHFAYPVNTNKDVKKDPVSDNFSALWREFVHTRPYGHLQDWYSMMDIENKQGNISIREAEAIASKLSLKSYSGGYKVMIIWHGEKMNSEAANKLLKLIEEPSPDTLIILVTSDAGAILPTIASRMQRVDLRRPTEDQIRDFLIEEYNIEATPAAAIAHHSAGDLSVAIAAVDNAEEVSPYGELFVRFVRSAFMAKKNAGELNNILSWAEDVAKLSRESQKQFVQYAFDVFHAALMKNYGVESLVRVQGLPSGFNFTSFSTYIHSNNINDIYDRLNEAAFHIERNANARITFFDMAVKVTRYLHAKAL